MLSNLLLQLAQRRLQPLLDHRVVKGHIEGLVDVEAGLDRPGDEVADVLGVGSDDRRPGELPVHVGVEFEATGLPGKDLGSSLKREVEGAHQIAAVSDHRNLRIGEYQGERRLAG